MSFISLNACIAKSAALLPSVYLASRRNVNAPMTTGFAFIPSAFASENSSNGLVPFSFISVSRLISGTM